MSDELNFGFYSTLLNHRSRISMVISKSILVLVVYKGESTESIQNSKTNTIDLICLVLWRICCRYR